MRATTEQGAQACRKGSGTACDHFRALLCMFLVLLPLTCMGCKRDGGTNQLTFTTGSVCMADKCCQLTMLAASWMVTQSQQIAY
jgi:hypothetical protein